MEPCQLAVSENSGTPKWMVYNGKPYQRADLGVPLFLETPNWSLNDHIPPTEILWLCLHMCFFFPIHQDPVSFQGSIVKFTMLICMGVLPKFASVLFFASPQKIHSNEKVTRFTHGTLCSEIRIQSKGWQRFSSTSHDPRFLVLSDLFLGEENSEKNWWNWGYFWGFESTSCELQLHQCVIFSGVYQKVGLET